MTHIRFDTFRCILILLTTTLVANGDLQNLIELQVIIRTLNTALIYKFIQQDNKIVILLKNQFFNFSFQHRRHLPNTKFGPDDYAEYSDNNEPAPAESDPNWDKIPLRNVELSGNKSLISESILPDLRSIFELGN